MTTIEPSIKRNALIYVRARTLADAPAAQLESLRHLAVERGWKVAGEFVGSPSNPRERERLIAAVHGGAYGAGVLVIPGLSSLSTTIRDVVFLAHDLFGRGWELVSQADDLDTTDATRRAVVVDTIANLAALDQAGVSERARFALDQARRRDGRQLGRKRRAVPVQQVRELLEAGCSWREIARQLGIPAATLHAAMKRARHVAPGLTVLEAA